MAETIKRSVKKEHPGLALNDYLLPVGRFYVDSKLCLDF